MPLLQTYLAGRGLLGGVAEAGLAGTLVGHGSLAGDYLSFACGCPACAGKSMSALESGDFGGVLRGGDSLGFRQSFEQAFRIGDGGPDFKNPGGGGDTVLGTIATTHTIVVGGPAQTGFVNTPTDNDWYRVDLVAGQSYVFTLTATGVGGVVDAYLELRNSEGALLAIDDDAGPSTNSLLRFTATASGPYYINARAYRDETQESTGGYTLTAVIGPPQDPLDTIDLGITAPLFIEVYFSTTGDPANPFGDAALRNWTAAEINAAFAAMATISAVTPIVFVQTAVRANAEWILTIADLDSGTLGYFGTTGGVGYGAFDPSGNGWTMGLSPGGGGFATLVHEFGHGLGLAHPHDNGGNSEIMQGVTDPFSSFGTFQMNQGVFTVMSYNSGWQTGAGGLFNVTATQGNEATPMALDVALLQDRYGANPNHNNGDNSYVLTGAHGAWVCIWDTGGNDTISYAGASAAIIDLRAATLQNELNGGGYISYVQNFQQGFTIAAGVTIENAVGGSGNDTLNGNSAANRLTGNAGNDALNGMGGVDTSVYSIASTSATWVRNLNGTWTVTGQGVDTLASVEFLDFTDRDVFLDRAARTLTGDGTSDILFQRDDGLVVRWEVTGTTLNSASIITQLGAEWSALTVGDLNGDGRDDIVWRRNDGLVFSWEMNGSAIAGAGVITALGAEWTFVGSGDFNLDLRDDLVWQRNDGLIVVWQMNGRSIAASGVLPKLGPEWSLEGVADFNGDGRDDFLWRNENTGLAYMWQMDGIAIASAGPTSAQPGLAWEIVAVGDTNGDGRDDIIWQNANGTIVGWQMNGTSIISSGVIASVNPAQWEIVGMGDYNGDGRDDLLFQNANGTVFAWILNGNVIEQSGVLATIGAEWGFI